jgi:hypothetical protein
MRKLGIIGALAGMLGRVPAQIRENFQLAKLGAVKVLSHAEALGTAADPHAAKRAAKAARRLNRATRRRIISQGVRDDRKRQPKESITAFYRRRDRWSIPKALKACGHNTRVRGH